MESLNHVEPVVKKEDVASLGKKEYASWPSSHAEDAPTSKQILPVFIEIKIDPQSLR